LHDELCKYSNKGIYLLTSGRGVGIAVTGAAVVPINVNLP